MTTFAKKYSSKSIAKKVLHKIFSVGSYSEDGNHATARFVNGTVIKNNDGFNVELSSTYWSLSSLEKAFKVGIDKI